MNKKKYQLAFLITLIILILSFFLGYTYYADAEAIQQIYAEVYSLNRDIDLRLADGLLDINFTLNITNPSSRDINSISSTFDIYIEDNFIGEGSFSDLSIKANSNEFKEITITFKLKELTNSIIDFIANSIKQESTKLTINGTMTASILFGLTQASHNYIATS